MLCDERRRMSFPRRRDFGPAGAPFRPVFEAWRMNLFDLVDRFISLAAAEQDAILLAFHEFCGDDR